MLSQRQVISLAESSISAGAGRVESGAEAPPSGAASGMPRARCRFDPESATRAYDAGNLITCGVTGKKKSFSDLDAGEELASTGPSVASQRPADVVFVAHGAARLLGLKRALHDRFAGRERSNERIGRLDVRGFRITHADDDPAIRPGRMVPAARERAERPRQRELPACGEPRRSMWLGRGP